MIDRIVDFIVHPITGIAISTLGVFIAFIAVLGDINVATRSENVLWHVIVLIYFVIQFLLDARNLKKWRNEQNY